MESQKRPGKWSGLVMKMRHPSISALLLLILLLVWPESLSIQGQTSVRAIVFSWDGAVPAMIDDLLRQGKLPNLAKLIAGGAFTDSVISVFPSKTAPGHASLWTGAPPRFNGISGNRVPRTPRNQFTILESASGFDSAPLRAEPLWMPTSRSGWRAVLAHGPFGGERSGQVVQFQGYASIAGRDGVIAARHAPPRAAEGWTNLPESAASPLEITFTIGTTRLFGLFIDDPRDPVRGYDTLIVTERKDGTQFKARLKAGASKPGTIDKWSSPIEVRTPDQLGAGTYLRLFDLNPDGSDFLLYFTRPTRDLISHPELLPALKRTAGTFVGNGASGLYNQGALGATIANGGDGRAEQRYLETVILTQRQLMDTAQWVMQKLPWDLLFTYTPYPDESEHLWRGYVEATLPGFRQDVADRLRPFLEEVYRSCDEFLGLLMKLRPGNTVIALVSDHGMEGVNKAVTINTALERAGFLVLDKQDRPDLTRTKALYPAMNNAYILLNTKDRKGGIVDPEERAELVTQIRRALREIRDGGREVVTGIFDAQMEGEAMGIGGEAGGDIYLDLLPGYDFDSRLGSSNLIVARKPYGTHGFNPQRMSMRTIMVLNGHGVAVGQRLREVRTIDFAPTLAKLVGIAAPRHATGRVLVEALTPR